MIHVKCLFSSAISVWSLGVVGHSTARRGSNTTLPAAIEQGR
jgi:hypothetical protein